VADFVGAANVIAATTQAHASKGADVEVQLAGARLVARAVTDIPAGPAQVLARQEDVQLHAPETGSGIPGTVLRRQYLGSRTHYKVRFGSDGPVLSVERTGLDHGSIQEGAAVRVVFDKARTLVVPR
jgi:iron(III) transport system ATP-binding protein